jgi:hypothetical protein
MGIRIHKAMGWGIRFDTFKKITLLKNFNYDSLYDVFDDLKSTGKDLIVPDEWNKKRAEEFGNWTYIIDKDLLNPQYDKTLGPLQTSYDYQLFEMAGYGDAKDKSRVVIFYPNRSYRNSWYRYDDALDYTFFQYPKGVKNPDPSPKDYIRFMKFNPYPYTNNLMTKEGKYYPWKHFIELNELDDWAPCVPHEIIWYTTELGIFDEKGSLELRPVLAEWWE